MLAEKQVNDLAERKRLLLLEADLHRRVIGLEWGSLRARLAMLNEARSRVVTSGPWLFTGSAVAGLLVVRHWRKLLKWSPIIMSAARWLRKSRSG